MPKAGPYQSLKKTTILTTEETHNSRTGSEGGKWLNILCTLAQPSVQMETTAQTSREGRGQARQGWGIREGHWEPRRVTGDQG